jgi:translation initiation factor IF-2
MNAKNTETAIAPRPPIVVVMGHVDHGKSTLLDYIRKTNIVDREAGGITQHLSAYEVEHTDREKNMRRITFLDTPGHEAFTGMRSRGATVADIAILVISAEDGIKAQTKEVIELIKKTNMPYVVAINKIDKPNANIEKVKYELLEYGVYLEGLGGDVPFVPISATKGTGINDLLETVLLVADMNELKGDYKNGATGLVIESHIDSKTGSKATLVILDGVVKKGEFIVTGQSFVGTRMLENYFGKAIEQAGPSQPITLTGFNIVPNVGEIFETVKTKKEAEALCAKYKQNKSVLDNNICAEGDKIIPIIIKTDVAGTNEAILREIGKIKKECISYKIISAGVGNISEGDIKLAGGDKDAVIIGFNVKIDNIARDINEQAGVRVETFDIIYKLTEWLEEEAEKRRPRKVVDTVTGSLKILKYFSQTKEKQVVGCRVESGSVKANSVVKIMRRDNEIGMGKVTEMQHNKSKAKEVFEGDECGLQVETKITLAQGDILQAIIKETK